jgi:hypothetical protein
MEVIGRATVPGAYSVEILPFRVSFLLNLTHHSPPNFP